MIEIGSRLELFVDDFIVETRSGVDLGLQQPAIREVVLEFDRPWEGNTCTYVTIFRDGDRWRMYYRGSDYDWDAEQLSHPQFICYAESTDGINWARPSLGLF